MDDGTVGHFQNLMLSSHTAPRHSVGHGPLPTSLPSSGGLYCQFGHMDGQVTPFSETRSCHRYLLGTGLPPTVTLLLGHHNDLVTRAGYAPFSVENQ